MVTYYNDMITLFYDIIIQLLFTTCNFIIEVSRGAGSDFWRRSGKSSNQVDHHQLYHGDHDHQLYHDHDDDHHHNDHDHGDHDDYHHDNEQIDIENENLCINPMLNRSDRLPTYLTLFRLSL